VRIDRDLIKRAGDVGAAKVRSELYVGDRRQPEGAEGFEPSLFMLQLPSTAPDLICSNSLPVVSVCTQPFAVKRP
jgi:hypothetical protein